MIKNSGCVSKSTYSALRARDSARRDAKICLMCIALKKNGELYKKPFSNGFKTREEAEEQMVKWEELNPNTKFAIVER